MALWNAGNAVVIVGSLVGMPPLSVVGGVVLVAALVLALLATRGARHRAAAFVVRAVYVVLALSIPIGLVLVSVRVGA